MSGSHLSDAARCVGPARQRAVATWLPRAAPLQRVKSTVGTARRRPDSAARQPLAPPHLSRRRPDRVASQPPLSEAAVARSEPSPPCPKPPTPTSTLAASRRRRLCRVVPRRCPCAGEPHHAFPAVSRAPVRLPP
jgi:hypothetical protein